jgi:hypothetical protein
MKSNLKTLLAGAGFALGMGLSGAPAHADVAGPPSNFYISYDITSSYPVSNIDIFEQIAGNGYGITSQYSVPAGTTTIGDPFEKFQPIAANFLLGVATDLPGDPPGQQHLVVFTNDTFAASAQSVAFGTLFPNTNETTLINDLVTDSNFGDLFDFSNGDAVSGPNGSIAFGSTDTFSEIAFSTGQIIGTGVSVITQGPPAAGAVPEPAAWVMMIVGFGLTGGLARRRRGAMAATA